jgi:hypothetical protein
MAQQPDEVADDATAAIRSDIERTRARIAATVDAIEGRLRPSRLMSNASRAVQDVAAHPVETMRVHPVPTIGVVMALIALAVAMYRRHARHALTMVASLLALGGPATTLYAQAAADLPPTVTASGCVVQAASTAGAPPTGHEQAAATGLTLTRATLSTSEVGSRRSAVPGSLPSGSGTGTTDSASPRGAARVEQSFWLVGAKAAELLRFLGRRVELTGTIDDRLSPNPGGEPVTDTGAAAARRAPTAPADPPAVAHPSAPTRAISVKTFRLVGGTCS